MKNARWRLPYAHLILAVGLCLAVNAAAVSSSELQNAPAAVTKDGKKLLSALDTLRIQGVGSPTLSPDGSLVAYTVSETRMEKDKEWKSVTQLWVVPAGGGPARPFTRGERSATSPEWSPDGKHVAFLTDREKDGEQQVWFMRADGGEAWQVTAHKGGVNAFSFSPDGSELVFTATDQPTKEEEQRKKLKDDPVIVDRNIKMTHLWLWDIPDKTETRLTEGEFHCSDPQWSPDGTRIAFTTQPSPKPDDGGLSDIWVLTKATKEKKKLVENPGSDSSPRWSPDGRSIAYIGNPTINRGVSQSFLYVLPASGGAPRKLTGAFELDPGTPSWSRDGKTIFFGSNTRQAMEIFACDVESAGVRQVTRHQGVISLAGAPVVGDTIVGTFTSGQRPTEVFRANGSFRSLEALTDQNEWLQSYALGKVEEVRWRSKDGTEIEGVLTKPVGFEEGKKYPFLLNPHGGPTGASMTSFNPINQLFAANGYLVLQPNFRGSTGRGAKFAAANKNTWGIGDYEDCMSGVDMVIERGWADPAKLGAHGWSYGGYMTFWILTQTDRFKAVSPGAGLTNIYSMYSQNDIQRYLKWFYDDKAPWDNVQLYWDRSPMKYIKQVKTPTLILHGERDARVPLAQAQEFYRGLVDNGIPVEFVVYPREGHGIREPRHQLDRLRRYLSFFGKYLDNPPVTEPDPSAKVSTQ